MKIYGPYTRKDNRQHVIILDGQSRRTVSYPKFIVEQQLGRELYPGETVDHINNDFTDNRIENLQILSREDNIRKHHAINPAKELEFICPICGQKATRPHNHLANNRQQGKIGPFCSRSCAGKFSKNRSHYMCMFSSITDGIYLDPATNKRLKSYRNKI